MPNDNPNIMYNPLSAEESRTDNDNENDNYNDSHPSDCETLLSNNEDSPTYKSTPFSRKRRQNNLFYLYIALIPIISICLIGFGAWIGSRYLAPTADEICPSWGQHYSPILKEVDNSIHLVRFNGSFMKENDFRLEAGPKVDAAWESIGVGYRSLTVPASEAPATGLAPDQVKISSKYGGGYPANVEGLHHLHCLNLVRQSLYYNIDYYRSRGQGAFKNEDYIVKYHVSHCLDIIRQRLMCQPDTGLLGQVWWDPEAPKAFVDFNTQHKCRNFDAIRRWAEERQISETVPEDFLEPPKRGDRVLESIP